MNGFDEYLAAIGVSEVFRFFKSEDHADALLNGQIHISTLERCRAYEDPLQGDSEEGVEWYYSGGTVAGSGSDPDIVAFAESFGIYVGPHVGKVSITNATRKLYIRDAYVLCATLGFLDDGLPNTFGQHCVKIDNLGEFFLSVTKKLSQVTKFNEATLGKVIYKERSYKDNEESPGLIGFVKPPDKYAAQQEFRFIWYVHDEHDIAPITIECPEIMKFVTRIK